MSASAPFPCRFDRFVEPARARLAIWRVIAGSVLLVALVICWMYGMIAGLGAGGVSLAWISDPAPDRAASARMMLFLLASLGIGCILLPS